MMSIRSTHLTSLMLAVSAIALATLTSEARDRGPSPEFGVAKIAQVAPPVPASEVAKPTTPRPSYATWFKFAPTVLKDWEVAEVPNDPMRVKITPLASQPNAVRHKVLVLYPRPSSAYDIAISKILEVFENKEIAADIEVVNFNNKEADGRAAIEYAQKVGYQLILSMGSESTAFLWKHYKGGALPVVSVCSKDPVILGQSPGYDQGSGTNFAFTSLNMPIEAQMAYVLRLRPNLKNIGIMVDVNNVSAIETQAKPVADYARSHGIRVIDIQVRNAATAREELEVQTKAAVASMAKNDLNLEQSIFWVTGSTAVFKEIATINQHASRVPVISAVPEVVQAGDDSATLGIGISFESNAHLAAVYASDVLTKRAKVSELKVGVVSPPDIAINFRKTREIGLKVPFSYFESANLVFDYDGRPVRTTETAN